MYKLGDRTLHLSPIFAGGWIGIGGWFTILYKSLITVHSCIVLKNRYSTSGT